MKQLQKSDLKEGDIYVSDPFYDGFYTYLNKHSLSERGFGLNLTFKNNFRSDWILSYRNMREATPEEKHWLKECIKADNLVSYEEAMKTLIPEYVECIFSKSDSYKLNKIYKVEKNTEYVESETGFWKAKWNNNSIVQSKFKPSTKEAYDAQFKKLEFVLPEIWWVRITQENLEDVATFLGFTFNQNIIGKITGMVKHYHTGKIEKGWNAIPTTIYGSTFGNEITTEQFRKYVLKKEPVVFEEPKDTVLRFQQTNKRNNIDICITEVQCSEGGIYKIGDKITVFDKTSPNKGKPFTIQGFRWNNAKTKLCAVTELHTSNGIGLDKIELYIEPKVELKQELSLLEQAKLKYPVGTKIISPTSNALFTIKGNIRYGFPGSCTEDYIFGNDGECSLYLSHENKWAEIVEDFVLPEKWCIRLNLENVNIVGKWFNENSQTRIYDYHKLTLDRVSTIYNILHYPAYKYLGLTKHGDTINKIKNGYTEITFEQFKKYILNETL